MWKDKSPRMVHEHPLRAFIECLAPPVVLQVCQCFAAFTTLVGVMFFSPSRLSLRVLPFTKQHTEMGEQRHGLLSWLARREKKGRGWWAGRTGGCDQSCGEQGSSPSSGAVSPWARSHAPSVSVCLCRGPCSLPRSVATDSLLLLHIQNRQPALFWALALCVDVDGTV